MTMTLPPRPHCLLALALATAACAGSTQDGSPAQDPTQDPDQDLGLNTDDFEQSIVPLVTTANFTSAYTGQGAGGTTCDTQFQLAGQEPAADGTYPVFLYMVGTTETFTNASATAAVAEMAGRGFVAATVQYDSASFGNCTTLSGKASCMFNAQTPTSAVNMLCARTKADCEKGVVVAGFSQGSVLATLAKNYDPRVEAAWGMGDGVNYAIYNLASCVGDGKRKLPSSRLRAIDGERDMFIGPNASNVRSQFRTLTGLSCGTATSCLQKDGSGWYIIQNAQTTDRNADHCYMRASNCTSSENTLDKRWQTGTEPWELAANLAWLASYTRP